MANTFDTSRVGGGTYELEQDSNGNYALKSVGFEQVNKLNLPNLTNLDIEPPSIGKPIIKPIDKPDVADPFNQLASQQGDDNRDRIISQNYEHINPKDISVRQAGDRQALDPRDDRSPQEIQNLQNAQQDYRDASTAYRSDMGSLADKAKMDAANETIMSAREKYATETQYNTPKTTGLQPVKSNFQKFKDKANQIVKGSATVRLLDGIGNVLQGIGEALLGPDQVELNNANTKALRALG